MQQLRGNIKNEEVCEIYRFNGLVIVSSLLPRFSSVHQRQNHFYVLSVHQCAVKRSIDTHVHTIYQTALHI